MNEFHENSNHDQENTKLSNIQKKEYIEQSIDISEIQQNLKKAEDTSKRELVTNWRPLNKEFLKSFIQPVYKQTHEEMSLEFIKRVQGIEKVLNSPCYSPDEIKKDIGLGFPDEFYTKLSIDKTKQINEFVKSKRLEKVKEQEGDYKINFE